MSKCKKCSKTLEEFDVLLCKNCNPLRKNEKEIQNENS